MHSLYFFIYLNFYKYCSYNLTTTKSFKHQTKSKNPSGTYQETYYSAEFLKDPASYRSQSLSHNSITCHQS